LIVPFSKQDNELLIILIPCSRERNDGRMIKMVLCGYDSFTCIFQKYGLKVYLRDPSAYTPLIKPRTINGREVRSLLLGRDEAMNRDQISQFSSKDAKVLYYCSTLCSTTHGLCL